MVCRTQTLGTSTILAQHEPNVHYSAMAMLSRHNAPTYLTCHGAKLPSDTFTPCPCLPSTEAKRSGQAERSVEGGFGGSPPTTTIQLARTPKKAKPSAAARPGAADKEGFRGLPGYDNPPRTHVEEGQAARPSSRLRHNTARPRAKESHAQRPGRAQRKRGVRGSPSTTTQHSTPTRERKPSAAVRPSAAEKGVRGSPLTTTIQLARIPKKTKSNATEKGSSGPSLTATLQLAHAPKKPSAATTPSAAERGRP
jgi:hypothetical protein